MTEIQLTPKERQALKARAHALKPVVLLGAAGLTPAVLKEIDRALSAHELIKVRVPGDDRVQREAMWAALAETLSAARVQAIGKLFVLYRPAPVEDADPARLSANRQAGRENQPSTGGAANKRRRNEVQQVQRAQAARREPSRTKRAAGKRKQSGRAR